MATFYPELGKIRKDRMEKHTEGEMALLNELACLPDDYSVYFQPYVNYAHPDIILLHPKRGMMIIEVKDWHLSAYSYTPAYGPNAFGYLQVKGEDAKLTTPFAQVNNYKDEFFDILCPELLEEQLRLGEKMGRNVYGVIKTAVYFHKAANEEVLLLFGNDDIEEKTGIKKHKKYTTYWCRKDLTEICAQIDQLMQPHPYYSAKLHNAMCALLVPSDAWLEQTKPFDLDSRQKQLAQCTPNQWSRIKGIAGSGKTLVLAQKAINCYTQKQKPVLILTYNITLRNYIRDRIAQNTRNLSQRERERAFEILHYDAFLPQICMRLELQAPKPSEFKGADDGIRWEEYHKKLADLLKQQKEHIIKCGCQYDTILIDEAQDYGSEWFSLIEELFLTKDAEFMVVADEKQNIYERPLEDKLPVVPGFHGPWRKMMSSYRLAKVPFELACDFQKTFMTRKYDFDLKDHTCLSPEEGCYRFYSVSGTQEMQMGAVWKIINGFRQEENFISPNDICVLLSKIDSIRELERTIKSSSPGIKISTMCETKEEYEDLHVRDYNHTLEKIRRMKKHSFNMNSGTIKLCTVHSFKGWEISTVVLVLDSKNINDELVYTALTRAKRNVIVISFGNERYDGFFDSFTSNHEIAGNKEQRKDKPATKKEEPTNSRLATSHVNHETTVVPAQFGFTTPAMRSDMIEKKIVEPRPIMPLIPQSLKYNCIPIMLEPAEQKKMSKYLSIHQPELMEDCPDHNSAIQYVVKQVFKEAIRANYIVSNYCYESEATGNLVREFAIRSCDSTYLNKRLGTFDRHLKIHGLLNPSNVFRVKDIEIVSQTECTENERLFTLNFKYLKENPKYPQGSALDEVAKIIPSYAHSEENELGLWTEYIDWKQRLAEIKVFGIKYIDCKLVEKKEETFQFHFLAVMPDNQNCERMIKLVKREREQISVFTSAISKERWTFVFNQENKYNDLGLRFAEIKRIALDNWISEGMHML